jgi:energy-converting hydrogenase Eha subunit A
MHVTRDEAAQALDEINKASGHIVRLKGYHHGAPYFIVWGVVWLYANTVTQFWSEYVQYAWPVGIAFGAVASTVLGFLKGRSVKSGSSLAGRGGRRMAMTSGVVLAFILCLVSIARPESPRESNAMVSILFPFMYMCAGIWAGWRLFAVGFVTAAAIMFGYFNVQEWFNLWMGVFAGGSLIAGGIWLRMA